MRDIRVYPLPLIIGCINVADSAACTEARVLKIVTPTTCNEYSITVENHTENTTLKKTTNSALLAKTVFMLAKTSKSF